MRASSPQAEDGTTTLGVALIDKPAGVSSFSALAVLKRACMTRRVGHTGTLDPFATGLLVALVGSATRCARYFEGLGKEYEAVFTFGVETDTDDSTGKVIRKAGIPDWNRVANAMEDFRGTIEQRPPAYSAVHVGGRRAYQLARSGVSIEIPSRTVEVHSFAGEPVSDTDFRVSLRCSSGTYVRSIARDLGRAVGSAATVASLRRTSVGPFSVNEALLPNDILASSVVTDLRSALRRLGTIVEYEVTSWVARRVATGGAISADDVTPTPVAGPAAIVSNSVIVATGAWEGDRFSYHMVVPSFEVGRPR